MKILFIASKRDRASVNIAQHVIERFNLVTDDGVLYTNDNNFSLRFFNSELTSLNELRSKHYEEYFIVFLSRHESASKKPCLTVHVSGLWKMKSSELSVALCSYMFYSLGYVCKNILNYGLEGWSCSYEATHHGPIIDAPSFFIEIGSSLENWTTEEAGKIIADALYEAFRNNILSGWIGIGGPHYAPKITSYSIENKIPIGHIAPKYILDKIDLSDILLSINRTFEEVKGVVVDWKGTNRKQRERLIIPLKERGYEIIRI